MPSVIIPPANYSGDQVQPLDGVGRSYAAAFAAGLSIVAGQLVAQRTQDTEDAVHVLNFAGTVSGGTFTLSIGADETLALDFDISNANLKTAIELLLETAGYEGATVTLTNGPAPADVTITFGGTLAGLTAPVMVVDDALLTGGGSLGLDVTEEGGAQFEWGAYDSAATNGLEIARGISRYSFVTDIAGAAALGESDSTSRKVTGGLVPIWLGGRFDTQELTNLDADAVTSLGRLERGVLDNGILIVT